MLLGGKSYAIATRKPRYTKIIALRLRFCSIFPALLLIKKTHISTIPLLRIAIPDISKATVLPALPGNINHFHTAYSFSNFDNPTIT